MNKKIVICTLFLGLSATPWLAAEFFTASSVSFPYQCKSQFSLRYIDAVSKTIVVSDGSMLLTYHKNGTGVGTYAGNIDRVNSDGILQHVTPVHRTFTFNYAIKEGMLQTTTTSTTINLGGRGKDEDVNKYIYPGFENGHTSYGLLIKIRNGGFTVGNNIYPRALCSPSEQR